MPSSPSLASAPETHQGDLAPGIPPPENNRYYPALDGLRALAVLMVFTHHYSFHFRASRWGWTGVDIFFVLSGFLITGILYDTRDAPHRFRNFYVRRTLRIFPLFYGVLLLGLILTPVFHWVWHPAQILWPLYLGNYARFFYMHDYLQNTGVVEQLRSQLNFKLPFLLYYGHLWSLAVEEQFYLVWPLVVFFVRDRVRLRNICAASFFVCLLARIICRFVLPADFVEQEFLYRVTPLRADALLAGGFLALALRGPEAARLARFARPVFASVIAIFALLEIASRVHRHHFLFSDDPAISPWLTTIGYSLIDLGAAGLVLLAIDPSTLSFRILNTRSLRRLGQMSYGFYVFHDLPHIAYFNFIAWVNRGHSWPIGPLVFVLGLIGTLTLSYLSFRYFEAPFLRLKNRFTV